MKTYFLYLSFFLAVLVGACQSTPEIKDAEKKEPAPASFKNDDKIEAQMLATDNDKTLSIMNSLSYNNNDGSTEEAIAYIDKNKKEVKIDEKFSDVKTGNYGTKSFYIENGVVYATKEVYFDNEIAKPLFVERVSFYNPKGKVVFTKERYSDYEEDLPQKGFVIAKIKDCSIKRAMTLLNQEGEFATTFQGFIENEGMKYLLVGENTPDGFASAIAIQYNEGDIRRLSQDEKGMIGKLLEVQSQTMVDDKGLSFQVLLSVKIK